MKTAKFGSKPKARRIGQEDSEDESRVDIPMDTSTVTSDSASDVPVFRKKSAATKRKTASKLRVNYDSSDITSSNANDDDEELATTAPVVIKKPHLARQVLERNASSSASAPTASAAPRARNALLPPSTAVKSLEQLTLSSSRPSYSAEALRELRTSTPSTPKDTSILDYDPLDVASKFAEDRAAIGADVSSGGIPDPSVVNALKARRAMLASNPDYISLTTHSKHESRLQTVGGDEEAFLQSFVEDDSRGGLVNEAENARRKQQSIREAIESSGSEDSSDDDEMREWESAQIRSGGLGSMKVESLEQKLKKAPTTITPLPSLGVVLGKLEGILGEMNAERERKVKVVEELIEQRAQIEKREKEVQELLRVKGEAYERLRRDIGGSKDVGRGLESFGEDKTVTMVDA